MRVADYVAKLLVDGGVTDVFMITGGGSMHLNDALGHRDGLRHWPFHHEQACAIAAEGYFRTAGRMAAVNVTSGPGGTNTLTGVLGQWTDSIPVLYLSGQVKRETKLTAAADPALRQLGDQECDILSLVRPITKYAATLDRVEDVRRKVEEALWTAQEGRQGPVWLDIPLDIQGAQLDPGTQVAFQPPTKVAPLPLEGARAFLDRLAQAERPVLVAGHGIRLAGAERIFQETAERLGLPILTTFNGFDLVATDHPLYMGHPGTLGTRAGNFILQAADLVLFLGTRNNIRQVSYNWQEYAGSAFKAVVDVDPAELRKPTLTPDLPIQADAGAFLQVLARLLDEHPVQARQGWRDWCTERREQFPVVPFDHPRVTEGPVDPYLFVDTLGQELPTDAVVVAGNGTACVALFQAGIVKRGQRQFWNSGCASMGYDLPAALGAALARPGEAIVCLAGDGSLQMNIQELQTLAHLKLPIKLFVLNNQGYLSIRQTQDAYFGGRYTACNPASGVSFPDVVKLAEAFGLPASRILSNHQLQEGIQDALRGPGPRIIEVLLDSQYVFSPRVSSQKLPDGRMISKPLEDMFPFLPPEAMRANRIQAPKEPS